MATPIKHFWRRHCALLKSHKVVHGVNTEERERGMLHSASRAAVGATERWNQTLDRPEPPELAEGPDLLLGAAETCALTESPASALRSPRLPR